MKTASKEGSALLIVMCFVLIGGGGLTGAILGAVMNQTRLLERRVLLERALHRAETGLEMAAKEIVDSEAYYTANTLSDSDPDKGSYTVSLNRIGFRSFAVTSVGTVNGVSREVSVDEMFLPTYGQYGWWTRVNGPIYFIPGDVLYGHTHTDDIPYFACWSGNGPLFEGPLTTMTNLYYQYNQGYQTDPLVAETLGVQFEEGFMLGSEQGTMADVPWTQRRHLAMDPAYVHGLYLEGETYIAFTNNLAYITNSEMGLADAPYPITSESLIYVADSATTNGFVHLLGGTLDGALTIFSEDDMFIEGHLTYANDPRDDHLPEAERAVPELSDDGLGLVSMDDVLIPHSAPDNLQIFAGIMATGAKTPGDPGQFALIDYVNAPIKGDLTVFGSVVQEERGAVGTFGSGAIRSGFFKDYYWDPRFKRAAPPHFPTISEEIRFLGWNEGAPGTT